MKKKHSYLLLLLIIAISSLYANNLVTVYPSADMYTNPNNPTHQIETELWIANNPNSGNVQRTMIRFDLDEFKNYQVDSAILRLTRFYSCPGTGTTATTLYPISEPWDEDSWNVGVHIGYNEDFGVPFLFSGQGGSTLRTFEVDITQIAQFWVSNLIDNHGIVIAANINQRSSRFYSKEFANIEYRPRLVLKLTDVSVGSSLADQKIFNVYNVPNPFNPNTTIHYSLQQESQVTVEVFNPKGQIVRLLYSGLTPSGEHQIIWDGMDDQGNQLPSAVYLFRVKTDHNTISKNMLMLK